MALYLIRNNILGDKFREKMIDCEVSEGFFKYEVNDIRKRRR